MTAWLRDMGSLLEVRAMKRLGAGGAAALVAALVLAADADAFTVGDGTYASGVGPVGWHWEATIAGHSRKYALLSQELETTPAFEDHPEHTGNSDRVLVRRRRLAIRVGSDGTHAPLVEQQLYTTDTGIGVNVAGIVTNADVRRLEVRYAYSAERPATSPGVERLVLEQPVRRRRLDHTPLKFWLAGATGGPNGYPYHVSRIRGEVRVRIRGHWRLRWRLLFRE
jgi:hypothetical protein